MSQVERHHTDLRRLRKKMGLTQEQFCKLIPYELTRLKQFEQGKREIPQHLWDQFDELRQQFEQQRAARAGLENATNKEAPPEPEAKDIDGDDIVTFWRKRGAMFRRYRSEVWDRLNRIPTLFDYFYFGALSVVILFTLSVNGVLPQVPLSNFFFSMILLSFVVFTLGTPLVSIETYKFMKRLKADFVISPRSPNALSIAQDAPSTASRQ